MNTIARITDSAVVSSGNVDIDARNNTDTVAVAGALAGVTDSINTNTDGTTAIGFAIGINVISNDLRDGGTLAYVEDSEIDVSGDLDVDARASGSAIAVVVAAALNEESTGAIASVAVGLGLNVISTRTRASVRGKKDDEDNEVDGDVSVKSSDTSLTMAYNFPIAVSFSGTGGTQGSSSVGAGMTFNVIATDVQADISNTTLSANSVDVSAAADGSVIAAAVSVSAAEQGAVAGQLSLNYIEQNVTALISGSTVTTTQDTDVSADDISSISSLTGAAAFAFLGTGGGAGVGAALSFNITNNTTEAVIDQSTVTATDGSVTVVATSDADVDTVTAGVAAGQQTGVGGSISTVVLTNETEARMTSSTVTADRNLLVRADSDGEVNTFAGAVGFGKQAVGVGASLAVSVIDNSTKAYIDESTVAAKANDSETITVQDWDDRVDESEVTASGLAVIASNTEDLNLISLTAGFGRIGATAINLAPTILTNTTYAYIEDTDVNSATDFGGDVIVRSHHNSDFFVFL
ncbi:MAG: hypothetical protein MI861_26980, partial [Pirellulales bacterium]|nr:hypothetical protein [Pirellulales bacterium]